MNTHEQIAKFLFNLLTPNYGGSIGDYDSLSETSKDYYRAKAKEIVKIFIGDDEEDES